MEHKYGEFFKKARESRGLSQRDLARALGFSSGQYISMLECGKARPPIRKLHEMALIYKLPLQKLVNITRTIQSLKMETTLATTKLTKEKAELLNKKIERMTK